MPGTTQKVNLDGGVAVITGAASGIGEALARHAASEFNMQVVLADIDKAGIERVASDLVSQGFAALPVQTDVTDPAALDQLAQQTREHFGTPRLLVNNAGIETLGWSWEIPAAQWDKILDVNIHGVVHGVRAFLPAMLDAGQPCIVANLSSLAGVCIAPLQTSYVMSKHAVLAFSECLQMEMQMQQAAVQVSAVMPGPVKTRIFSAIDEATDPHVAQHLADMVELLDQNGMEAGEAASMIFTQLAEGKFWVSTHPEMVQEMAAVRAQHLSALDSPAMDSDNPFFSEDN